MASGGHGGNGLPLYGLVEHFLHSSHQQGGVHVLARPLVILYTVTAFTFAVFAFDQTLRNFEFALFLSPLWLPPILIRFAVVRFVQAKRAENQTKQEYVLLELRMPRDTQKTPLAMETVFSSLHLSPGESTWYKKYINGSVRPSWSFEIASIGGRVRFFIRTSAGFRRIVESSLYAQYPNLEVIEAIDYSMTVEPTAPDYDMWACEFIADKPHAYPIKTYIEYGLDKPGMKPEEQVDPLAQLIEGMGALGPGEQLWLQFIIRVTKGEKYIGRFSRKGKPITSWKDEGRDEIERIREETAILTRYKDATGTMVEAPGFPNPTKGQVEAMAAMERNTGKLGFDVGIRGMYLAPKDKYQGATIPYLLAIFKPFNSPAYNSLGVDGTSFLARFNDWPWEDPGGHHKEHEKHNAVEMYRRRAFFHDPYVGNWNIMSTEELATLYHVPSGSVLTPGLARIGSSTSEAPANLPT